MKLSQEIIDLRKKLLKNVKEELKDRLGPQAKEIEKYYNEYRRELNKGYRCVSTRKELIKKLKKQDIVLCGDYHTLQQAQNTAYKIILELIKKREVIICLEFLNHSKQKFLDKYISGEIEEQDFLKSIHYKELWGFNWNNYKPIMCTAIKNKLKVFGINNAPNSLKARDKKAAELIVEISKNNPNALIFVLFGDLHIASVHLPRQVKLQLKEKKLKKKMFQVFQNSEQIYWQILENEPDTSVDVVKLKSRSYCIQNTPPWIKLQSYLIWTEHGEELTHSPALTRFKGEEQKELPEDLDRFNLSDVIKEQFFYILEVLCKFFKIDQSKLNDPQIFTLDDPYFQKELEGIRNEDKEKFQEIKDQITVRKSYYIPEKNSIFLSSFSLYHAAHCASIYLFFEFAGIETHIQNEFEHLRELFYTRVLLDAIGFLGSKIINPKRKCFTYSDHNKYYESHKFNRSPSIKRKVKIAKYTMLHRSWELKVISGQANSIRQRRIYKEDSLALYGISKTIGYQLGDALYFAMMYNMLTQDQILALLNTKISKKNTAYKQYIKYLKLLKDYEPLYKSKSDIF